MKVTNMIQFSLFKIPIYIQPFFWIILALIGGAFNINDSQDAIECALFVLAGFISILIHELGHALMMKKYHRQPQIVLHGLGGVAMSQGAALSRSESFLVTLAGPAIQIALGVLALFIYRMVGEFPTTQSEHFLSSLVNVSIGWALLNLIPVYPLDGGQLMAAIFGPRKARITHYTSIAVAAVCIAATITSGMGFFLPLILGMLIWDNIKVLQSMR